MNSHQILRGVGPISVDRWCGNVCETITQIPNSGEHMKEVVVVHYIEDDLVDVVQWTRVSFHADMKV